VARASAAHARKVRAASTASGERSTAVTSDGRGAPAPLQTQAIPSTGISVTAYDNRDRGDWTMGRVAVSSTTILGGDETTLKWLPRDEVLATPSYAWVADFLGLPATQAAAGATPAWDERHGRWVLAATAWEYDESSCDEGWLLLAVSAGSDPEGGWTRWRIPIGAQSASDLSLGLSADLIAIGANEYALDGRWAACLSLPFTGARLRVVDWADIVDGGTLTVADLTPPQPRRSWSYHVARTVPETEGAGAGGDLRLIVDRYDATEMRWGNVGFGRVTGSVIAGSAALSVVDLTSEGIVPRLVGPPWLGASPGYLIQPRLGEHSGLDEAAQSVAARGDAVVFAAASSCIPPGGSEIRTCVRTVTLDVSDAPRLVDDSSVGHPGGDDIFGNVGYATDGTLFLLVSTVHGTVATWRDPGETVGGTGRAFVTLPMGEYYSGETWPARGAVDPDPVDPTLVWSVMPVSSGNQVLALRGGVDAPPSGVVGPVPAFSRDSLLLDLRPATDSPIVGVRTEATSPTSANVHEVREGPSARAFRAWLGQSFGDGPRTVTVRWKTADGVLSDPVTIQTTLDESGPTLRASASFLVPQTLGSRVRTRWTLAGDDRAGVGVGRYTVWDFLPGENSTARPLTPEAPFVTFTDTVGVQRRMSATVWDALGNQGEEDAWAYLRSRLVQSTSSSVRAAGSWSRASASKASGDSVRTTRSKGATLTIRTTGSAFALAVTKGPGRGKLAVSIDGGTETIVDTRRSSLAYRQVVWQASTWQATHTVKVRVLGTSGRPRIDVDAFLVLEDDHAG
jgi:hypothetical protein